MTDWKDKVIAWMGDPVTVAYMTILQAEARGARENAMRAVEAGDIREAASNTGAVKALRWALTELIEDALTSEKAIKEASKRASREENPEDVHPARLADALSEDDGDGEIDADPHGGEG